MRTDVTLYLHVCLTIFYKGIENYEFYVLEIHFR